MARQSAAQQAYEALLDRYGETIAHAFAEAVGKLKSDADLQRLVISIERRDINGALDALHLDPAVLDGVAETIRQAFAEAGSITSEALPSREPNGTALVLRFALRNPVAERFLQAHGAEFVTRILEDQREAVRLRLVAGMEQGQNPRSTALEIVGRINRATGRREGGILGMTAQQETFAASAKAELASDDPADLRHYLTRARRDRRFDRSIQKAIREGKAPDPAIAAKAVTAYENRLTQLRGEVVGRTEALRALNAGSYESLRQAVEAGKIPATAVRRVWRSAGDLRVRHTHAALNGDTVGLNENFQSPSGAQLLFPGDPAAPIAETAQCRCWVQPRIDWGANLT